MHIHIVVYCFIIVVDLEFSCGQVGNVEFLARLPERTQYLEEHQVIVLPSAYLDSKSPVTWSSSGSMDLQLPLHPKIVMSKDLPAIGELGIAIGGILAWTTGDGRVSNWYDHPLERKYDNPRLTLQDPDDIFEWYHMLCVRPAKQPILVDGVHTIPYRMEYAMGEAELVYTHPR